MALSRMTLLVLLAASSCAYAGEETNRVGMEAPTPVLVDLDGNYTFLSHLYYQGAEQARRPRSVVILYFTALNCPPCRKLLPELLEVVRPVLARSQEAGTPMRFFMVSTDPLGASEELLAYLKDRAIDAKTETLLDPYRKASELFGVSGIPHTIVISPEGRLTADIVGAVKDFRPLLIDGIKAALKPGEDP